MSLVEDFKNKYTCEFGDPPRIPLNIYTLSQIPDIDANIVFHRNLLLESIRDATEKQRKATFILNFLSDLLQKNFPGTAIDDVTPRLSVDTLKESTDAVYEHHRNLSQSLPAYSQIFRQTSPQAPIRPLTINGTFENRREGVIDDDGLSPGAVEITSGPDSLPNDSQFVFEEEDDEEGLEAYRCVPVNSPGDTQFGTYKKVVDKLRDGDEDVNLIYYNQVPSERSPNLSAGADSNAANSLYETVDIIRSNKSPKSSDSDSFTTAASSTVPQTSSNPIPIPKDELADSSVVYVRHQSLDSTEMDSLGGMDASAVSLEFPDDRSEDSTESSNTDDLSDQFGVSGDICLTGTLPIPRVNDDMVTLSDMRKKVVTNIINGARHNLALLSSLSKYKNNIMTNAATSKPAISQKDAETIFYEVANLERMHQQFVDAVEPKLEAWGPTLAVGEEVKIFYLKMTILVNYVLHNNEALATVQRCKSESDIFCNMAREITWAVKDGREKASLEDALMYPLQWLPRNASMLEDLQKYTAVLHPDHKKISSAYSVTMHLVETLSAQISTAKSGAGRNQMSDLHDSRIWLIRHPKGPPQACRIEHRERRLERTRSQHLLKCGQVVELRNNERKLRRLFLFSDILVCAKIDGSRGARKNSLVKKWTLRLRDIRFSLAGNETQSEKPIDQSSAARSQIRKWKKQLTSIHAVSQKNAASQANIREKYKKKIDELESNLALHVPRVRLSLFVRKRAFVLLFASEYERNEWKSILMSARAKAQETSSDELHLPTLLASYKEVCRPSVNVEQIIFDQDESSMLTGVLRVVVHSLEGLQRATDVYVVLEIDSYGVLYRQTKTNIICGSVKPEWKQAFDIELEGAQALRILCYEHKSDRDELLGMSCLQFHRRWLSEGFHNQAVSLTQPGSLATIDDNGLSLTMSVEYMSSYRTIRRVRTLPMPTAFGAPISRATKDTRSGVPVLIVSCLAEVERRGLTEEGIYRVSANATEIDQLKASFEKDSSETVRNLDKYSIHAVTGVLKLYLRSLPSSLFTDELYADFINGFEITDPTEKQNCLVALLMRLPQPNLATALLIIDHLVKISQHSAVNKMTLQNLATIFGMTLIRPADDGSASGFQTVMRDAAAQMSLVLFFLNLRASGFQFDRQI